MKIKDNHQLLLINKGFTLLELMIVLAIIAILTAIAYPAYQDSIRKSRRANAQADLMGLANFMEREFTENNTYPILSANLPYQVSPQAGTAYYNLTISAPAATTFTLQAVPTGAQAADTCGTLTLDQVGLKTPGGAGCW